MEYLRRTNALSSLSAHSESLQFGAKIFHRYYKVTINLQDEIIFPSASNNLDHYLTISLPKQYCAVLLRVGDLSRGKNAINWFLQAR